MLCAWAGENWRWYINFIEQQLQALTRGTLSESISMAPPAAHQSSQAAVDQQSSGGSPRRFRSANFTFEDLQRAHYLEEKANEGLLVLRANITIIQQLREYYREAQDVMSGTPQCVKYPSSAFAMLSRRLNVIIREMELQETRFQSLLQLLADRRELVCCLRILPFPP